MCQPVQEVLTPESWPLFWSKEKGLGQDMNAAGLLKPVCMSSAQPCSVHHSPLFFSFLLFGSYPGKLLMGTVEHACPMWRCC